MKPLYDKNTNLIGWISKDRKSIFDLDLNWVGFVANDDSVWSVKSKTWIGNLYGYNIRDINGKTIFWNPETPIQNSLKPLKPLKPLTPLRPLRPLRPFTPLRPLRPLTPLGGWSNMNWNIFNHLTNKIMGLISKTDLFYKDYSWTAIAGDNPKVTGKPDSTLLNRKEGYEILYFVNEFSKIHSFKHKSTANKVEKMIREEVPNNIRSQEKIKTWIEQNWENSKF